MKANVVRLVRVSIHATTKRRVDLGLTLFFLPFPVPKDLNSTLTSNRGCRLGDQHHMAGTSWHPYLPPNGFDTCTVCTCNASTLEIKCPRVQCPSLPCSEKVAFRPDKMACCKQCPEVSCPRSLRTIPKLQLWLSSLSPGEALAY